MSHGSSTNFWSLLLNMLISILKMAGFLVGWCFKAIGFVFTYFAELLFKLIGK